MAGERWLGSDIWFFRFSGPPLVPDGILHMHAAAARCVSTFMTRADASYVMK